MIDKTAFAQLLETQQTVCGCSFERSPRRQSFWEMSRTYFTPSRGFTTDSDFHNGGAENLRRLVEGKPLPDVVDKHEKR